MLDAVVVGAGPNGLSAAITLAGAGKRVLVIEGSDSIGGGARTEELTIPGVRHDVCSSVHPLGAASPAFARMPLEEHGLRWLHPGVVLAHPFDDGTAATVVRDVDATCADLGGDADAWRSTVGMTARRWQSTLNIALSHPLAGARRPVAAARFARMGLLSAHRLAGRFETRDGRALIAGLGAHAAVPLTTVATAGVALVLGAGAHAVGWPFAAGGSSAITDALAAHLRALGGEIVTGRPVRTWGDLPSARVVMLATSPEAAARVAADRIGPLTRRRFRSFRRGVGVFKVDVAIDGPVPWRNAAASAAGTLHLGGEYDEVAEAEARVARGEQPEHPFVIASQPVVADPHRAPAGTHVVWAYCHVPAGSKVDMRDRIIGQIERFAPGFERRIVAVAARGPADLEADNPNHVGGDITGGALSWRGLFARPTLFRPYRAGRGVYLCSASTPPGAGVHGMCGHHAARSALRAME
jgi:phytoene dehydrogenase-like protein